MRETGIDMEEIWVKIIGFNNYEVSNLGSVRSIDREVKYPDGHVQHFKSKILKPRLGGKGYQRVILHEQSKKKQFSIHILVWDHFKGGNRGGLTIDHIDNNKTNNWTDNLQLLTNRSNIAKGKCFHKNNGLPTGVYLPKGRNKYVAYINIKNRMKYLGAFYNVIDASNAYQEALRRVA